MIFLPENESYSCEDTSTVTTVTTTTSDNTTTTTTNTQTCTKTTQSASDDDNACRICGNLNLDKLYEQTRATALRSSNLAASTSNGILLFTQIVIKEILKQECCRQAPNLDNIILLATTIAALAENIHTYNPQPFNP